MTKPPNIESKIEKLHLKVRAAHENQGNPVLGKRYFKDAKKDFDTIREVKNTLPGIIKKLETYLGKIDTGLGRLENAGMIEATIQFRDGDKMVIVPPQVAGKRVRIYVGKEKDLQIMAGKYIENFETHQHLAKTGKDIAWFIHQMKNRMLEVDRVLNGIEIKEVEK